jgi:hypothetical protein
MNDDVAGVLKHPLGGRLFGTFVTGFTSSLKSRVFVLETGLCCIGQLA